MNMKKCLQAFDTPMAIGILNEKPADQYSSIHWSVLVSVYETNGKTATVERVFNTYPPAEKFYNSLKNFFEDYSNWS
jgi:hypothetical protein